MKAILAAGFALTASLLITGCGIGTPPTSSAAQSSNAPKSSISWPAPPNAVQLARKAGLVPEDYEHLEYHVHAHLDVFVNGKQVTVPAGIGISMKDPKVKHQKTPQGMVYGWITNCGHPCISPLHTHDTSGVMHTETSAPRPNTLGEFFVEWNRRLTSTCVSTYCEPRTKIAVYVDGKRFHGDPRTILLANHREIAIVIGKRPKYIPIAYNWGQL